MRQALKLWRGASLSELTEPFAAVEGARLEELRLTCLEERLAADLQLGRHAAVAGELAALVERHPLREGLVGQLMRALSGTGRQVEALEAYRTLRDRLDAELGMKIRPAWAVKRTAKSATLTRRWPRLSVASSACISVGLLSLPTPTRHAGGKRALAPR
jgi:DNA-binding SARP family transcriptional activator